MRLIVKSKRVRLFFLIIMGLFLMLSYRNNAEEEESAIRQLERLSGQSIGPVDFHFQNSSNSAPGERHGSSYTSPRPPSHYDIKLTQIREKLDDRISRVRGERDKYFTEPGPRDYENRINEIRAERDEYFDSKKNKTKLKEPDDSNTVKMAKKLISEMETDLQKAKKIESAWKKWVDGQKCAIDNAEKALDEAWDALILDSALDVGLIYSDELLKKYLSKFINKMNKKEFSTKAAKKEWKKKWKILKKECEASKNNIPYVRDLVISFFNKEEVEAIMKILLDIGAREIVKKIVDKKVAAKLISKTVAMQILKKTGLYVTAANFAINRVLNIGLIIVASEEVDEVGRNYEENESRLMNCKQYIYYVQTNKGLMEKCLSENKNSADACNCLARLPGWGKFNQTKSN